MRPVIPLVLLLSLSCSESVLADRVSVGRLFSAPVSGGAVSPVGADEATPPPISVPRVKIDGLVSRSSGRNSVWLNGQVVTDRQAPELNTQDVATVKVDEGTRLKVGELLDRESGSRTDVLPGRAIVKGNP